MEIRPLTQAEQKYAYRQSMQIRGQTGSIGILQGGYGADSEFHSDFHEINNRLKTGEFEQIYRKPSVPVNTVFWKMWIPCGNLRCGIPKKGFRGRSTVSVWKQKSSHTLYTAALKKKVAVLKSTVM